MSWCQWSVQTVESLFQLNNETVLQPKPGSARLHTQRQRPVSPRFSLAHKATSETAVTFTYEQWSGWVLNTSVQWDWFIDVHHKRHVIATRASELLSVERCTFPYLSKTSKPQETTSLQLLAFSSTSVSLPCTVSGITIILKRWYDAVARTNVCIVFSLNKLATKVIWLNSFTAVEMHIQSSRPNLIIINISSNNIVVVFVIIM